MANSQPARTASQDLLAFSPAGLTSDGLAQHKLSRLLELRAVIDAMRLEHENRDPLLAWVKARERTGLS
jgi:hypothetical protein